MSASSEMSAGNQQALPFRIQVAELVSSRYEGGARPLSWDERREGRDIIRATDGKSYTLVSDGQQSPPQKDWVILLKDGDSSSGYYWTLYAIPPAGVKADLKPQSAAIH